MIISARHLEQVLHKEKYIILDSRWYLMDKRLGKIEYDKKHIPNAIFFDIEFFSKNYSKFPHAIPFKKDFEKKVSDLGISNHHHIIIYDQSGYVSSTRVWFLFKFFGHKKISILDGGINNWIKEKKLVTSDIVKRKKEIFFASKSSKMLVTQKEIKSLIKGKSKSFKIIDARPEDRFLGKVDEPRKNVKKGRISCSINIPFNRIHNTNGLILKKNQLEKLFQAKNIEKFQKKICYCGSGITACNLIFALNMISHNNIFLYDGSWAEWGQQ